MTHTITTERTLASIGEEISHELGAKMVKDFQDANPKGEIGNYIGREILERILEQPGCQGINFYNAINEVGRETLVYVGVNENSELITKYTGIDVHGKLVSHTGIVADRSAPPGAQDLKVGWWD
ncbi:MAG: hypothetical protein ABI151_16525 [Chitinophagaceae bacterium]